MIVAGSAKLLASISKKMTRFHRIDLKEAAHPDARISTECLHNHVNLSYSASDWNSRQRSESGDIDRRPTNHPEVAAVKWQLPRR